MDLQNVITWSEKNRERKKERERTSVWFANEDYWVLNLIMKCFDLLNFIKNLVWVLKDFLCGFEFVFTLLLNKNCNELFPSPKKNSVLFQECSIFSDSKWRMIVLTLSEIHFSLWVYIRMQLFMECLLEICWQLFRFCFQCGAVGREVREDVEQIGRSRRRR